MFRLLFLIASAGFLYLMVEKPWFSAIVKPIIETGTGRFLVYVFIVTVVYSCLTVFKIRRRY